MVTDAVMIVPSLETPVGTAAVTPPPVTESCGFVPNPCPVIVTEIGLFWAYHGCGLIALAVITGVGSPTLRIIALLGAAVVTTVIECAPVLLAFPSTV